MKYGIPGIIIICAILTMGFVKNINYQSNEKGCAGSGCHAYLPGFIRLENQENLKLKVVPEFQGKSSPVSAELRNEQGRIVDFQKTTYQKDFILNAPRPGRYKVLVGYQLKQLYWDSLAVEITHSNINIPTARFGTSTFEFFPLHPNTVKEGAVIRFILPKTSEVEIFLYTSAGKPVTSIFKGNLSEGIHELSWDGKDSQRRSLPPGKYLCELRSGRKKLVQQVFIQP